LLFSSRGVVRKFSHLEAAVLRQLGPCVCSRLEHVICLSQDGPCHIVLLLFVSHFFIIPVVLESDESDSPAAVPDAGPKESARKRGVSSGSSGDVSDHRYKLSAISEDRVPLAASRDNSGLSDVDGPLPSLGLFELSSLFDPMPHRHAAEGCCAPCCRGGGGHDSDAVAQALGRMFQLSKLRAVQMESDHSVRFIGLDGRIHRLLVGGLSRTVQDALLAGFHSALASRGGRANWAALDEAVASELWRAESRIDAVAGRRVLETVEVERWRPSTSAWDTPSAPVDRELCWRWVEASGKRHPHLFPGLSCEEAAKVRTSPPCEPLSGLFQPETPWTVDCHEGTDGEGWSYSVAWNSSVWKRKPSLWDTVRRRRWTRTYA